MNFAFKIFLSLALSSLTFLTFAQDASHVRHNGVFLNAGTPAPVMAGCDDSAWSQPLDEANFFTARTSDRASGIATADNFMFAEETNVNSVCWWGIYWDFNIGGCPAPTDAQDMYEITYFTDNAGSPGAVHAGPFAVSSNKMDTGVPFASTTIYNIEAEHPVVTFDAASTYYLQITSGTGSTCWFLWVDNIAAPNDGVAWQDAGAGFGPANTDQTFNLGLAPDDNDEDAEPIPTMGEWGLIILGLLILSLGLVFVTRREKTMAK